MRAAPPSLLSSKSACGCCQPSRTYSGARAAGDRRCTGMQMALRDALSFKGNVNGAAAGISRLG